MLDVRSTTLQKISRLACNQDLGWVYAGCLFNVERRTYLEVKVVLLLVTYGISVFVLLTNLTWFGWFEMSCLVSSGTKASISRNFIF